MYINYNLINHMNYYSILKNYNQDEIMIIK